MIGSWYELWVDDGLPEPYILIVTQDPANTASIIVIDTRMGHKSIHRGNDYDSVKLWLLEDEYRRVDGRMRTDD